MLCSCLSLDGRPDISRKHRNRRDLDDGPYRLQHKKDADVRDEGPYRVVPLGHGPDAEDVEEAADEKRVGQMGQVRERREAWDPEDLDVVAAESEVGLLSC